ncbi:MAG TPA: hypothetical protein VFU29_22715, partial [Chitinophagaceae bacterium]|nr:hypothetical protein [Chitinophagaceae bacterium]
NLRNLKEKKRQSRTHLWVVLSSFQSYLFNNVDYRGLPKVTHNVQAFVLLGASSIRRPRRRLPNEELK